MEILRPGSQVSQKIGRPFAINANGSVSENDQKAIRHAGKLTQGALLTICQGGTIENPNLQILSSKRIDGSSSERYRLLISDGMYSNSYAMLTTQLNWMVAEKQLDDYCVVQVKRLECNTMRGKKVIIILEMEILCPGS